MGFVFQAQGKYDEARVPFSRALDMADQWYPREAYPRGHYDLATCLTNLGQLLELTGEHADAWRLFDRASTMYCDLDEVFVAAASEAEALDYLSRMPSIRACLISCSLNMPDNADLIYGHIWSAARRRLCGGAPPAGFDVGTRRRRQRRQANDRKLE